MIERIKGALIPTLAVVLCLFTLLEVNSFTHLLQQEQSKLAVFAMLGMVLCFLTFPLHKKLEHSKISQLFDFVLAAGTVACCGYVVVQMEPLFESWWIDGQSLGNRAGMNLPVDMYVGLVGLVLVLEATRRSIGLALPILAVAFLLFAYFGRSLPDWAFPHSGLDLDGIASSTFLQSTGIFGVALNVMFKYVFLFVIFGAMLEITGGTQFIIDFSEKIFGGSAGGPAKIAVLGSGLMGSLSGSAVANAVTTGTFTIPMMRNAGFKPHIAGGITAAAASGGALVPPIMGAGAYMMLEIVNPKGGFVSIMRAAIVPAILYYFSIFMIVHFSAKRIGAHEVDESESKDRTIWHLLFSFEGIVFFGALGSLIGFLLVPYSAFRAVTFTLGVILVLGRLPIAASFILLWTVAVILLTRNHFEGFQATTIGAITLLELLPVLWVFLFSRVFPEQWLLLRNWLFRDNPRKINFRMIRDALVKSARGGVSLIAASACVGIIIGIVQATGVAGDFNSEIAKVVEHNLFFALVGIMTVSIVLGMGVPSAVCYLLMATLMGPLLGELGVPLLAAHMFIFYFGMMSMVTPPVALAAYASASIAGSTIMRTAFAAFRFSLIGFVLPYMFIYRPELLLMNINGGPANWGLVVVEVGIAVLGTVALAAGITGFMFQRFSDQTRMIALVSAVLLLAPHKIEIAADDPPFNTVRIMMTTAGAALFLILAVTNRMAGKKS
ncbi:Sialic acid TRAP transporter permease protein SiaT [Symmachiella macrocystis]|uniref:Sialic acid TRAP transporter permease protein SiaT n=1 Tax=Symmachiella macrocystis TaxID=2527985 RepID=A0A5C6BDP0_9PLAN|nr:TRAP transporter fused permease subunit [Symmachiella macrocystis]TWU09409.1 Sialic acid TRAP transporter permease protein SiaT [Symmachiella macrocystis]